MNYLRIVRRVACVTLAVLATGSAPAAAAGTLGPVPSRIVARAGDSNLVSLAGNTHPDAAPQNDLGLANPGQQMKTMHLVLQRSAEQERALAALHESQYDCRRQLHHQRRVQTHGHRGLDGETGDRR
jgi:hypothetical protein